MANETPDWASRLGVVAILLGVLLTAWHANEWMKISIVGAPPFTIATMPEPDCDEDELIEEGLTLEECHQLAFVVQDIAISSPGWFKSFHIAVSATGTLLALLSIVAGIALVDYRPWAPGVAVAVFSGFALLDAISFTGVVNTGPLLRQMYLWVILLWFFIHLVLAVAAIVGRQDEQPANNGSHVNAGT
ncbi:MAG TPA: hypothetical protein VKZ91_00505 [Woeseiaceae bacterium]|nr:hypothetical protein [Woeseiaceae bacterium]